jgi:hypothetical protein
MKQIMSRSKRKKKAYWRGCWSADALDILLIYQLYIPNAIFLLRVIVRAEFAWIHQEMSIKVQGQIGYPRKCQ